MTQSKALKIIVWLGSITIVACITGLIAVALLFRHYAKDLPSVDQLASYDPAVITRLYSSNGQLLAEYAKEKRIFVPLEVIPNYIQRAFVSAEDRNFYEHPGIDFWGIARAAYENARNLGKGNLAGGSTITQQVVKNFLLTSEKSIERKVKEAILAWRISKIYSKEKILELYLNQIYLGRGSYGIAAAALNFFNRSLDTLTLEEAALLAAMPKAPSSYDPERNYDRALERRNYVLERMQMDGVISEEEAEAAKKTSIVLRGRQQEEITFADFFAEEVRRRLKRMYGFNVLYEGGLYVRTTLQPQMQHFAANALRHALVSYDQRHGYRGPIRRLDETEQGKWQEILRNLAEKEEIPIFANQSLAFVKSVKPDQVDIDLPYGEEGSIHLNDLRWARKKINDNAIGQEITSAHQVLRVGDAVLVEKKPGEVGARTYRLIQVPEVNGAMVVADPHTGSILAMVGGYSYLGSEFNRATQAKRQTGSAIKPFVYATALENGFSPTSVIMDAPIEINQGPNLPPWRPKNYGGEYLGPTTLRTALEKSRNLVTVRLAQYVGLNRIKRLTQRLGIYGENEEANYSMVLGAKETTLMRLTNAYAMIANGGKRVEPWLIERIDDRNGTTIFRRDTRICGDCSIQSVHGDLQPPEIEDDREQVLDPRVAYQLTSILQGAIKRGTGVAAKKLGHDLAGKTGTTNEERDAWFIGFSPDLVVGTFIGFDSPRPMGAKETGGRVAIAAFVDFMENALKSKEKKSFPVPEGVRNVPVNRYTGQPLFSGEDAAGENIIEEAFLTGAPIYKPLYELEEEKKEKEGALDALLAPITTGQGGGQFLEQSNSEGFDPYAYVPGPGQVAPYQIPQRPVENPQDEGFNPNSDAEYGTGGLY